MKKLLIIVLLTLVCINYSCEKDTKLVSDPLIESLENFIDDQDKCTTVSISNLEEASNDLNPLENLMLVYDHILIKSINNNEIKSGTDVKKIFSEDFLSSFPAIKPESINSETYSIVKKINKILISYDNRSCIPRLKRIENFIIRNRNLNEDYSDFLIGYCTFLRHAIIINEQLYLSKDEDISWEECMIEKAEELMGCEDCYLEKALFVFNWPLNLSIWAIDCGIASLKK